MVMVNKDIVFEKIKNIQNCLKRIHEKTGGNPKTLDHLDVQEIFVLNLQRAVQSTIDLAAHIISDEGLGLPSELKENFSILEKAKNISPALSTRMQKMVGFRNIAVHDYTEISVDVLKSVLEKDLKDVEELYSVVLKHFRMI